MIEYRTLSPELINPALFAGFDRHQVVTQCWRKVDGQWVVRDVPFVEEWGEADYRELADELRVTIAEGGVAIGAFDGELLRGFASVGAERFGSRQQYLELHCIHVTAGERGHGIGRRLLEAAKTWAKLNGAEKLYISAHSSLESQAFYRAMGCIEAEEYNQKCVAKEPCDCQLECPL